MHQQNKIKWVSIRQNKEEFNDDLRSIIHGNQLDIKVTMILDKAASYGTIINAIRTNLRSKGFASDTYKYIATSCGTEFMMYVQLQKNGLRASAGFSEKPITEFIEAIKATKHCKDIHCEELTANDTINSQTFVALANKAAQYKNSKAYSSTLKPNKLSFYNIMNTMLNELIKRLNRKGSTGFPENYEYTGITSHKVITVLPFLDNSGNGIIRYLVEEYDKLDNLVHSLEVKAVIKNYELVPNNDKTTFYYTNITSKVLFVYAIIEKSTEKIVYIGVTFHLEERLMRHMKPKEKDSLQAFLNGKTDDNSTLRGYDFWLKHPDIEKTAENVEKFKNYCVSWSEYEFRFLPLNHFVKQYTDMVIEEWKKLNPNKPITEGALKQALREIAEAYVMKMVYEQTPDNLIWTTETMNFFNVSIKHEQDAEGKHINLPLFFCTGGNHSNASAIAVENTLKKYSKVVSDVGFKNALISMLRMVRGTNIPADISMYEIFTKYALTADEAIKLAVGLSIDEPLNSVTNRLSSIEHRKQVAIVLLKKANFPVEGIK